MHKEETNKPGREITVMEAVSSKNTEKRKEANINIKTEKKVHIAKKS